MRFDAVRIAGAGLAGLSTAIALARQGERVEVYERRAASAAARPRRWDAVENWSTMADLRERLDASSIDRNLFRIPTHITVRAFDGEPYPIPSQRPLLLAVQRGDQAGSLDVALEAHARALGVRFHRGVSLTRGDADVLATGTPRRGLFLDVGLTFRTRLDDQVSILIDPSVAPGACAYLIAFDGTATLAVLLTRRHADARARLNDAIEAFRRTQAFSIDAPRLHSGFGGAPALFRQREARPLRVGEAAGLLDYLWGFGIRHALASGALAAQALLEHGDYTKLLEAEIAPQVRASLFNRRVYDCVGRRLGRSLVRRICAGPDAGPLLRRAYQPRRLRRWCAPWFALAFEGTAR